MFFIDDKAIDIDQYRQFLQQDEHCGALLTFEGWVRKINDEQSVDSLIYSCYQQLAITHGEEIIQAAKQQFPILAAVCVHRVGHLQVGDMAVWVGVTAGHRDEAYLANRYIIDRVKFEVPIWKQEFYQHNQAAAWLEK